MTFADLEHFTHVEGNLWVGGCERLTPRLSLQGRGFKHVISLWSHGQYLVDPGTTYTIVDMRDREVKPDRDRVEFLSELVQMSLLSGKTLVHCHGGVNRSCLVAGAAMIDAGRTAREAIDMLRWKRGHYVLYNKSFEAFLYEYDREESVA